MHYANCPDAGDGVYSIDTRLPKMMVTVDLRDGTTMAIPISAIGTGHHWISK